MKKFALAALGVAIAVAPAFAASRTVKFENDDGSVTTFTFKDDGTATTDTGATLPYTWDEASKTLCGDIPDQGQVCATFEEVGDEIGSTTTYTLSTGGGGTATLMAVEE